VRLILLLACLGLPCLAQPPSIPPPNIWKAFERQAVEAIAAQTDPAKLATLKGERAANPRLQKCVYWLAYAEEQGAGG